MGQSINYAAIYSILRGLVHPHLFVPAVRARDIRHINFGAIYAAGYRAICFDKDNTLTAPYGKTVYPGLEGALREARQHFEHLAVVSNSAGSSDDRDGLQAADLEASLGMPVIRHGVKKPLCGDEVIKHFKDIDPRSVVMIGDRLTIDVYMANRWNMLSIHTEALTEVGDNKNALWVRRAENWLSRRLQSAVSNAEYQKAFTKAIKGS